MFTKFKVLVCMLVISLFTSTSIAQNVKTYIPPQAFEYRDDLYKEIKHVFPDLPYSKYGFVPALIEHESCISLKHSRCWSPTAELSNKREYSIGFFQIAKAYNPDGTKRMDTLQALKGKYGEYLQEATWSNLKNRPDLQIRVGISLIKDNWNSSSMINIPWEHLAFTDNIYNGGGWALKERRTCSMTEGCDAQMWFDNTELYCLRSKKPIPAYGNRSICDISRNHTRDTLYVRMPKYTEQYFNSEYLKSRGE